MTRYDAPPTHLELRTRLVQAAITSLALLGLGHCGLDAPPHDGPPPDGPPPDAATPQSGPWSGATGATCLPREGDFFTEPRGLDDDWPACVSDAGRWVLVADAPSSSGRVAAFERIAALLFDERVDLRGEAFTEARVTYAQEQGLDSRVQRREDEHYPPATNAVDEEAACGDEGIANLPKNAHRCVGPARILPILNQAFADGITGLAPEENAGRIEGALLWFLFVSTYKEATTCLTTPQDCDSAWAYYTGGTSTPEDLRGLSRYVEQADPLAYEGTWTGLLALRCWRDLVDRTSTTDGPALHEAALAQLDRGLNRGLAAIIAARTRQIEETTGPRALGHWRLVQILGQALDRAARELDPPVADQVQTALGVDSPGDTDLPGLRALLAQLFPCP